LARDATLKEFVSRLAQLPLAISREVFEYGHSRRRAGTGHRDRLGQPLDQLSTTVCSNHSHVDTGFWVPPEKLARLIDPPLARGYSRSGRYQTDHAVLGRRRAGVDGRGLSAVLPDAAQRW